jgi:triacylglycerol lipase
MIYAMLSALLILPLVLVLFLAGLNRFAPAFTYGLIVKSGRRLARLQEVRITINGHAVPYLVGGQGAPLVLVHGFTANKDTFAAISRFLTPHFTVYIPDLPGFGDAGRDPDADYSMEAQAEYVHAFMHSLGLQGAHVGGNSMGGGISALLTARYPHDVSSLWLIDAAATQEAAQSELVQRFLDTGEFPLLNTSPEDYGLRWTYLFAKPPWMPYAYSRTAGQLQAVDYTLHKKILTVIQGAMPLEQRFRDVQVPALIVTGAQDRIVPPASVKTLAKVFVNSTVKIMPGVGHLPMIESPKQTANDYLAFVRSLQRTG